MQHAHNVNANIRMLSRYISHVTCYMLTFDNLHQTQSTAGADGNAISFADI